MKIAILDYEFIFDPSETWSNGFQFEKDLSTFFEEHGFDANIIQPSGNSGKRVIHLERKQRVQAPRPAPEGQQITQQVKKVQSAQPTKSFKTYEQRGVPKSLVNQDKRPPRTEYTQGRTNRQKLRGEF